MDRLLLGYYSFGFWLLLALELANEIIGRGDMVEIKLVTMLSDMKDFCFLDLKCSAMFCFILNFHRIYLNLYATLFMA